MVTFKKLQLFKGMIIQPFVYFKNYYKMTSIELTKQQVLDADLKAIQQIDLTGNLDLAENTIAFFMIEKT